MWRCIFVDLCICGVVELLYLHVVMRLCMCCVVYAWSCVFVDLRCCVFVELCDCGVLYMLMCCVVSLYMC